MLCCLPDIWPAQCILLQARRMQKRLTSWARGDRTVARSWVSDELAWRASEPLGSLFLPGFSLTVGCKNFSAAGGTKLLQVPCLVQYLRFCLNNHNKPSRFTDTRNALGPVDLIKHALTILSLQTTQDKNRPARATFYLLPSRLQSTSCKNGGSNS